MVLKIDTAIGVELAGNSPVSSRAFVDAFRDAVEGTGGFNDQRLKLLRPKIVARLLSAYGGVSRFEASKARTPGSVTWGSDVADKGRTKIRIMIPASTNTILFL